MKALQCPLFNVDQARALQIDKNVALALIEAGVRWTTADGWTTSRASQQLFKLTSVPLVMRDIKEYKHAWLYALTMLWGVDVEKLALSNCAAEAAFGLAAVISGDTLQKGPPAPAEEEEPEKEESYSA